MTNHARETLREKLEQVIALTHQPSGAVFYPDVLREIAHAAAVAALNTVEAMHPCDIPNAVEWLCASLTEAPTEENKLQCARCGAADISVCGCYDRCRCGHDRRSHVKGGVCSYLRCACHKFRVEAPTEERCINCAHVFGALDIRGSYGSPDDSVGPFCETCYATIKAHEVAPPLVPVGATDADETIVQFTIRPRLDEPRWKALHDAARTAGAVHAHINPPTLK